MATIADYVFDAALAKFDTEANRIDVCSSEPTTYTAATTTPASSGVSLGNATSISISAPADRTGGGRKVTVSAITNGSVTYSATATHYAIVDTVNSRLLATGSLSASQSVTSGNTFTLTAFDVGIPDPA